MSRRERVPEEWKFPIIRKESKEPKTVTFRVSIKLGDRVYDNAEVTFDRSDLSRIVRDHESYSGNCGGGFGG